jgi:uncharacterized coiled-coil protein SlyX
MTEPEIQTVEEERAAVAIGGIWTDENLDQTLDWQGETTGGVAAEQSSVTHTPQTPEQINTQLLDRANITSDVLGAIIARVEKKIVGGKNSGHSSILEMIETAMANESRKVHEWLESQDKKLSAVTENLSSSQTVKQSDIDRLDEKLRILEEKISAIITESTAHKTEEFTIINEAAKIIKDRRATEELEVESTPSILGRMETRADQLNTQLRSLEPYVASAHKSVIAAAQRPAAVRRKFGKQM